MKFILGTKLGMTQRFSTDGRRIPVTVVAAGPVVVTQVKTKEKDGVCAVQVGFGSKKKLGRAMAGHLKELPATRYLRQFSVADPAAFSRGQTITVEGFGVGERVKVTGTSKGKGFSGVVKRHHFSGGKATHGQKHSHRAPGSIGATDPQRVFKGTRMAGHMGAERSTVAHLEVVEVDAKGNRLYLAGPVPGPRRGVLIITAP